MSKVLVNHCCKTGDLDALKELFLEKKLNYESVSFYNHQQFETACKYGHLNVCKWLYNTFNLQDKIYTPHCSCFFYHYDVCQWLCKKYMISKQNLIDVICYDFQCALKENLNIELFRYLFNYVCLTEDDVSSFISNFTEKEKKVITYCLTPIGLLTKPVEQ